MHSDLKRTKTLNPKQVTFSRKQINVVSSFSVSDFDLCLIWNYHSSLQISSWRQKDLVKYLHIWISRDLNALWWLILTMYFKTVKLANRMVLVLTSFICPFFITLSPFHVCGTVFITFFKPLSQLSSGLSFLQLLFQLSFFLSFSFFFPLPCGQFNLSDFLFSISASFCSTIATVPYVNWFISLCIYSLAFLSLMLQGFSVA